ncbi:MAG: hypothetical protein RMI45_07070 [Ignisphaera sp.]|nr:hypothetical protein [Ignisphaera sp.]MDW8085979.1 hypothetical protein [Ignisphaera sp.]
MYCSTDSYAHPTHSAFNAAVKPLYNKQGVLEKGLARDEGNRSVALIKKFELTQMRG